MLRNAVVFFVVTLTAGCDGTTLVDVASESAALAAAQCDAQASGTAVDTCFETFRACRSATGADEAACRDALGTCLPQGLPKRAHRGGGDGGCGGHGPADRQGSRGERPDGGLGGRPHGHGRGHRGGPRGPVAVDDEVLEACRAQAQSCLDAGGDAATCRDTSRQCVHEAVAEAFASRCAELTTACATEQAPGCETLTQQCEAGLTPPVAGSCATDPAVEP